MSNKLLVEEKPILKNQYVWVFGKGGWGTVYKAWDMESGTFVAVKEIGLAQIPKEHLSSIMSEITLLQSLNHPLIVRYVDSIKTDKAFYIVLEFVENGSLEWIVRKFGNFPEHLIAKYMKQVLEGLAYLHGEGVIHRDIKGANLLSTKTGQIKLADFGVAVKRGKTSGIEEFEPAGSVRIINAKRVKILLKPYWMAPEVIEMNGATTKSDIWSVGCTIVELFTCHPPYFELETMSALFRIVQDDMPPLPDGISPLLKDFLMKCFQREPFLRASAEQLLKHRWLKANHMKGSILARNGEDIQVAVKDYNRKLLEKREEMKSTLNPLPRMTNDQIIKKVPPKTTERSDDSENDSDWDISDSDLHKIIPGNKEGSKEDSKSVSGSNELKLNVQSSDKDEQSESFELEKRSKSQRHQTGANFNTNKSENKPAENMDIQGNLKKSLAKTESKVGSEFENTNKNIHESQKHINSRNNLKNDSASGSKISHDDFDFDDLEEKSTDKMGVDFAEKLASKMNRVWDPSDSAVEQDPFDMFDDDEFDVMNEDESLAKDGLARLTAEAVKLIDSLSANNDETTTICNIEKLTTLFKNHPEERIHIIRRTGIISFFELLQSTNLRIVEPMLKIVNAIVEDSSIRESFCVMGGIQIVLQYANAEYPSATRYEAGYFIQQLLKTDKSSRKIFIASRGLAVLVNLIKQSQDYYTNRKPFLIGIDCISMILTSNLHIKIPKNDFCRILAKENALPKLARAFELILKDKGASSNYSAILGDIFVIFSKGDQFVKAHFCEPEVLKTLFNLFNYTDPPTLLKILKSISNLSMSPTTLESLADAGAIKFLVPLMARRSGKLIMETQQQLFSALYNLCRLNVARQLEASRAGIIPHLQWVIDKNHPLKQFALPILYEMARTKKTRAELYRANGVIFFLNLFRQQYPWQVQAIDSLSEWLVDDPKISRIIEQSTDKFIEVFDTAKDEGLVGILEPFNRIIAHCKSLNKALSLSHIFMSDIVLRLSHHNPMVRLNLLKTVKLLCEVNKLTKIIYSADLVIVVKNLEKDNKVLVSEMATSLSEIFNRQIKKDKDNVAYLALSSSIETLSLSGGTISSSANTSSGRKKIKEREYEKERDRNKKIKTSNV